MDMLPPPLTAFSFDASTSAYCSFVAALALIFYACSEKCEFEWPVKAEMPHLQRRSRYFVGVIALVPLLCGFYLFNRADFERYKELANSKIKGVDWKNLTGVYSDLFNGASNNDEKCYLASIVIASRLIEAHSNSPILPPNVMSEIKNEIATNSTENCYAKLAPVLETAIEKRKFREYYLMRQAGGDLVEGRDRLDRSADEDALGDLAPSPAPRGWLYVGKRSLNGMVADSPFSFEGVNNYSGISPNHVASLNFASLIEKSEPNVRQDFVSVAGVYHSGSRVRIIRGDHKGPYEYALVEYVSK